MKKILNKTISVLSPANNVFGQPIIEAGKQVERPIEYSYSDLIMICVKRPSNPQIGFSYDEIKSIDRVKKAIDEQKQEQIELHEVDYDFLKSKVDSMSWGLPAIEFVEFREFIKDVK